MNDLPSYLETLSDDAKAVAAAWFATMRPGSESELTLRMRESRPTARTQDALDELVRTGIVSCTALNDQGGLVYKPLLSCHPILRWAWARLSDPDGGFALTEKISPDGQDSGKPTMSLRYKS